MIRSRVPALSVTRERRANAGSKMASLIENYAALTEATDNDNEFYNTAYGGFDEDGEDEEFDEKQEEADDELDSDFDAEEVEEAGGEAEEAEEQEEQRKTRRSSRRKEAYEISADRRNRAAAKKAAPKTKAPQAKRAPAPKPKPDPVTHAVVQEFLGKRSLRQRKIVVKEEEDEPPAKKSKSSRNRSRKSRGVEEKKSWTQEELLQEAKETERENLASLQKYQLLELEKSEAKKRAKKSSREIVGPFGRFVSTTMPLVPEEEEDERTQDAESMTLPRKTERTFITFSDEATMNQAFAGTRSSIRRRPTPSDIRRGQAICPISNLPARYFDPVTQMPYSSSTTFRVLREAYCNQLLAFYGNSLKSNSVTATTNGEAAAGAAGDAVSQGNRRKQDDLQVWLDWKRSSRVVRDSQAPSS